MMAKERFHGPRRSKKKCAAAYKNVRARHHDKSKKKKQRRRLSVYLHVFFISGSLWDEWNSFFSSHSSDPFAYRDGKKWQNENGDVYYCVLPCNSKKEKRIFNNNIIITNIQQVKECWCVYVSVQVVESCGAGEWSPQKNHDLPLAKRSKNWEYEANCNEKTVQNAN